jgi:BlaI family transcriptional regulator, penicillinase repressor
LLVPFESRPAREPSYLVGMADVTPLTGELQTQVMAAVWRLEKATVEQVRIALPPRYRGAYNTIQTVLNRLADRKLLSRHKVGNAFEYRPLVSEAEYLSRSIAQALAGASKAAREAALAQLIGGLGDDELTDLHELAREMSERRRKR